MSLDMNTATKTMYSKKRTFLPKIKNRNRGQHSVEGLEIVGKNMG